MVFRHDPSCPSRLVIGAAIQVHRALGPGLLESVYERCLAHELARRGVRHRRQVRLPIRYGDLTLNDALRIDVEVESRVIVEIKAVERLLPIHEAQLLTYLRLSGRPVGLLMNFNEQRLIDGLRRRRV